MEVQRVVSVSLGSSSGDMAVDTTILGVPFRIEREGTDGDVRRATARLAELDGKVAALGLGGTDLYLVAGDRRYVIGETARMASVVRHSPLVDGSGLKDTLEREIIRDLQASGTIDFRRRRVLLTSAVDRFGMAETLTETGADLAFGDLVFALGIPLVIRSLQGLRRLARVVMPLVTRVPIAWLYPTGKSQETRRPRAGGLFRWADVIAGDGHLICRHIPDGLDGPTVITNTVRKRQIDLLRAAGVKAVVPTTPVFDGQSFGTNVMEGVFQTLLRLRGETPSTASYLSLLRELGWKPEVLNLREGRQKILSI